MASEVKTNKISPATSGTITSDDGLAELQEKRAAVKARFPK